MVQVGFGGHKNLETHQQSKSCKQKIGATKQVALLDSFFCPAAPKNPPTIRALPKVHAESSLLTPSLSQSNTPVSHNKVDNEGCRIACTLLKKLEVAVQRIPETAPLADDMNPLAIFSGDPDACVPPDVDCWEDVVNPMMKAAFGWGNESEDGRWMGKVCCGQQGIDGFMAFLQFCVQNRGLKGGLIEPKVETLLKVIDFE